MDERLTKPAPYSVLLRLAESEDWFTYPKFYSEMAAREDFSTFVEVGSWKGHSTRFLASELKARTKAFNFFAVDLWNSLYDGHEITQKWNESFQWVYQIYNYNLKLADVRDAVQDIVGDSSSAASQFHDCTVDFVFIDASHDYESVKKDIDAWLPKIRAGGIISGHDIHCEGVQRAVFETFADGVKVNGEENIWIVEVM